MQIEIWSDVVCPWCYIGKRRFEKALAEFTHHDEVTIVWRSFELDPNAPRQGARNLNQYLAQKLGVSPAQAAEMNAHVSELAAAEGLDFQLDRAQHGNTFDAHRLIHLAATHGRQAEAKERLLRAYFTEGRPIGDHETLIALGVELDLNGDEVRAALAGEAFADAVRADEERAAGFGIRGVPFCVFGERYGLSGAQSPETFLSALDKAWEALHG